MLKRRAKIVPGLLLCGVLALGGRCSFLEDIIGGDPGYDQIGAQIAALILARVDAALGGGSTSGTATANAGSFNLSGASSTSGTALEATFSEAPASGATTLANFCVTITSVSSFSACQSSPGLLAISGTPAQNGSVVTITSATQTASVYILWVQNVSSGTGSSLSINSASFIGTGATAFNVTGATSGGSTTVRVNFSSVPTANHLTVGNYCAAPTNHTSFANCNADGARLTLSSPSLSSSQVSLTSSSQSAITYYVWVQNVTSGATALTVAQASFTGQAPTPFNVSSGSGTGNTSATVTFSEAPNTGLAQTTTNYCITVNVVSDYATCSGGATLAVSGASLSGSTVTLTTAAQTGVTYYVWVQNVTSASAGTALTTANTSFSGTAPNALTGLVINEIVYGTDWFVEIYNTSGATIDLAANGARLRRDSDCSLPSVTSSITLTGTIAAGAYYSVGRGTFAGTANVSTTSVTLNEDDCVAITNDASNITSASASNVIDFVGYGGSANAEGGTAAPGWRNLSRCPNGTDTNVNSTNFTGRSDAQRTQNAVNTCTAATAFNVNSATSGTSTTVTVTFSEAPYESLAEVQGNYCVSGNTANSTFTDCENDTGNLLALSGTPVLTGSDVAITTDTQSAITYKIFARNVLSNTGGTQLTTSTATFTGSAPVTNATLVINEVATDQTSNLDLIELYVTGSGNLQGLQIYERTTSIKTLPNVSVTAGDYVVIHLASAGTETDETTSITQSSNGGNYTTAWDYWSTDGGLTGTDGTITLRDSAGTTILDALHYSDASGSWTGSTTDPDDSVTAGQWDAFNSDEADSVNQNEGNGNSYQQRTNGSSSNNTKNAWRVGASNFGAANSATGVLTLDNTSYTTTSATAVVSLTDDDLNTNTGTAQTVNITASSTSDATGISLTLTETGANTGIFTSTATGSNLAFCSSGGCSSSPTLQVSDGDTVTVSYSDAAPAGTRTDTATWSANATATVRINEIQPDLTNDLVELYVVSSGTLSGLTMYYGANGSFVGTALTLPNVVVTAGNYVIVHVNETGTNSATDVYRGATGNITVSTTGTVITVYNSTTPQDTVCFATGSIGATTIARIDEVNTDAGGDDTMWVTAGASAAVGDCVNIAAESGYGTTWAVHRNSTATDTQQVSDWTLTDNHNTMGAAN